MCPPGRHDLLLSMRSAGTGDGAGVETADVAHELVEAVLDGKGVRNVSSGASVAGPGVTHSACRMPSQASVKPSTYALLFWITCHASQSEWRAINRLPIGPP